jgi:hydrogenase maturation protein HypF
MPPHTTSPPSTLLPAQFRVEGTVQGVGFRPFIYRLARSLDLRGWVRNDAEGVLIFAVGTAENLLRLERRIRAEAPPAAQVERVRRQTARETPPFPNDFTIVESLSSSRIHASIPPDLAVCEDCLREMRNPTDRRYRYPFINCTNCGPRYSIVEAIPYDRPDTTMRVFTMCPACRGEYEDPEDRRFHAQPNACPDCGPSLSFWTGGGVCTSRGQDALEEAVEFLRLGRILAIKGIGGFHLMVDAANEEAVETLRERKRREEKPFALMVPDIAAARALCFLSPAEETLLQSPQAPILLALRRPGGSDEVAPSVAPANPLLGIMLPNAPLHHLLMDPWRRPLVATSGNVSDEPICTDEMEAIDRLDGIADAFLVHNRPIARPVDDSIVRFMMNEPVVLRRARGYAPSPISISRENPPVLAVGAHLKSAIAVTAGSRIFPSQHIGDLSTQLARQSFSKTIEMLSRLYRTGPQAVACDTHPDYHSTAVALQQELPTCRVQHHHAHVLSCMAEHHLDGPLLGVSWDGTGYGTDGTIWGGEFLVVKEDLTSFTRVAHLRTFRLPGGESAIRQPALTSLALLFELDGDAAFERPEVHEILRIPERQLTVAARMLQLHLNSPVTSSAGRLFDGLAALLGLGNYAGFEAQSAMKLEFAAMESDDTGCYNFRLEENLGTQEHLPHLPVIIDWGPLLESALAQKSLGIAVSTIARRIHNTFAETIAAVAREIGLETIVLSGGCFQNKVLTEATVQNLRENGFDVFWHRQIPPNDGGIAVGQALAATAHLNRVSGLSSPSRSHFPHVPRHPR